MIKTVNLTKIFRTESVQTTALNEVSLEINQGEFVAIMGPSGCGKSTLLNMIGLLDNPTSGELWFLDQEVSHYSENDRTDLRNGNLGFVFQSFNLIDELTVFENVELPLLYAGVSTRERVKRVNEALERMQIAHRTEHYPQQLSGGQQQRVAIARALAMKPSMLYFDEPTSALDPEITAEILRLLKQLAAEKMTMVIVTHEIDFARAVSDRVVFMDEGVVVETGTPEEVIDHPKNERTKAFLKKLHV